MNDGAFTQFPGNTWFVWSDEEHFEWFQTQAEAIAAADMLVVEYFDGTVWDESVESIKVGQITHKVVDINRIERPPVEISEDSSWGELEYKCDYEVRGIDTSSGELIPRKNYEGIFYGIAMTEENKRFCESLEPGYFTHLVDGNIKAEVWSKFPMPSFVYFDRSAFEADRVKYL